MGWMKHCDWALQMGGQEPEPIPMPPDSIQILASGGEIEIHVFYPDRTVDTVVISGKEAEHFLWQAEKFVKESREGIGCITISLRR